MDNVKVLLLKNLVLLLVTMKFSEIVSLDKNGRLSESEIKNVIIDYPGKITMPPESAYDGAYVYDVYDHKTEARKIEFDLWYDDEVSDLTLSVDIQRKEGSEFSISIDDIHVL